MIVDITASTLFELSGWPSMDNDWEGFSKMSNIRTTFWATSRRADKSSSRGASQLQRIEYSGEA